MRDLADWLADATGPWLATFVLILWGIGDAIRTPTVLIPYDRCILNALMVLALARLAYRGRA